MVRFFPRANDIWLNGQGTRFHNEDLSGGFSGTSAVLSQQPAFAWSLNDATVITSMLVMDPAYTADFSRMHEKKLELLNKSPFIVSADSLEALAPKMGLDPETLVSTVARFNKSVDEGQDAPIWEKR